MEVHAKPPEPMSESGNMAENWNRWIDEFNIFMKLTGYDKKPTDVKAYILRNQIGRIGRDAIENIKFERPTDKENINILIRKLDHHFNPPKNELVERFNFFTRSKNNNETFDMYVEDLKKLAQTCNFGRMTESLVRDRVLSDIKDRRLQDKLFSTKNLDIPKLVLICEQFFAEKAKTEIKENQAVKNVAGVQNTKDVRNENKKPCWRCKERHPIKQCPAWGFKCKNCEQFHHYTYCCRNVVQTNQGKPANTEKINKDKNILSPDTNFGKGKTQENFQQNNLSCNPSTGHTGFSKGFSTTALPLNLQPSAPELPEFHKVYPNLKHMNAEQKVSSTPSMNLDQAYIKTDEKLSGTSPAVQTSAQKTNANRSEARNTKKNSLSNAVNRNENSNNYEQSPGKKDNNECTIS